MLFVHSVVYAFMGSLTWRSDECLEASHNDLALRLRLQVLELGLLVTAVGGAAGATGLASGSTVLDSGLTLQASVRFQPHSAGGSRYPRKVRGVSP